MAEFALDYEHLSDVDLAKLVVRRDPNAVRLVTRRNNQRPRKCCGVRRLCDRICELKTAAY